MKWKNETLGSEHKKITFCSWSFRTFLLLSFSWGRGSTEWQDSSGNETSCVQSPWGATADPTPPNPHSPPKKNKAKRKTERKRERGQNQIEASLSHYASKLHNSLFSLFAVWLSVAIWIIVWYPSVWAWGKAKAHTLTHTYTHSFIRVITKKTQHGYCIRFSFNATIWTWYPTQTATHDPEITGLESVSHWKRPIMKIFNND